MEDRLKSGQKAVSLENTAPDWKQQLDYAGWIWYPKHGSQCMMYFILEMDGIHVFSHCWVFSKCNLRVNSIWNSTNCQNAGIPTLLYSLVQRNTYNVLEAELYFEKILILIQFTNNTFCTIKYCK